MTFTYVDMRVKEFGVNDEHDHFLGIVRTESGKCWYAQRGMRWLGVAKSRDEAAALLAAADRAATPGEDR